MSATEDATQRTLDPRTLVEIAERSSRILAKAMKRASGFGNYSMGDELGVAKAFFDLSARLLSDPVKLAQMQLGMWQDYVALWQASISARQADSSASPSDVGRSPSARGAGARSSSAIRFASGGA